MGEQYLNMATSILFFIVRMLSFASMPDELSLNIALIDRRLYSPQLVLREQNYQTAIYRSFTYFMIAETYRPKRCK